jgi:TonB family protein
LFELIAIFNWFNPVVYLYKSSIKHIHEFIADEVASKNEASKAEYAMLLFQEQFGVQAIPLTNNFFNQSLLKLRIKMLNKERSNQTAMLKYGLIAPLFMLMIVVSSATLASKELTKIEAKVEKFSEANLEEVIVKPSKTARAVLSDENLDLSDALIVSPDLVDEVQASRASKRDTNEVFDAVEESPEFVGGMEALGKFLQENLKYPEAAKKANYSGKVYTSFIVNTDGTTTNFDVLKSGEFGCNEEALRVLKLVPKWTPGKQSGRIVRCRFIVPINFVLEEEKMTSSVFAIPDNGKFVMKKKAKMDAISMENPLYIVDGVARYDTDNVNKIDPKTIESISIFKDEKAIMRYGDKGKNGVIVITLKKK